ncbi:hypothetical protein [Actinocrispum wychmicini]|uniref:Uncharacterized protein n=1 Tax=Actinocrispum wychmicini TaxID=1213861 RepID=A0A4R2J3F8_9PSEU|nr:hypothetical protein [Actinocrispum wychmicini]TCO52993.1 hypothetical protein EV192_111187 [Actinocrispum wychmicini]
MASQTPRVRNSTSPTYVPAPAGHVPVPAGPAAGRRTGTSARSARRATSWTFKPGKGGDVKVVKLEFLVGLVLIMLAPLANKSLKFDKNYARRLIAFVLLFAGLFALADARDPSVSRIASGLGGLLILTLVVMQPARGNFGVNTATLIAHIVERLQPK